MKTLTTESFREGEEIRGWQDWSSHGSDTHDEAHPSTDHRAWLSGALSSVTWMYYAEYHLAGDPFSTPVALYRHRVDDPSMVECIVAEGSWTETDPLQQRGLTHPDRVIEQVSADYAQAVSAGWTRR